MADRIRRTKESRSDRSDSIDAPIPKAAESTGLQEDLEDILDEIDEALEANAEEFVRSYVQKGGE